MFPLRQRRIESKVCICKIGKVDVDFGQYASNNSFAMITLFCARTIGIREAIDGVRGIRITDTVDGTLES